jgi:CRP-like cAMP-binding protein
MEGIPPARASDNEEVRWALETAESLWKRSALVDAIVWLRRAAQEAAQAGDEDRASGLMVEAAALTDAIARASAQARAHLPASVPPGAISGDVDDLLAAGDDPVEEAELDAGDIEELDAGDLVSDSRATPIPGSAASPDVGDPSSEVPTPTREPWATDDPFERSSAVPTPAREPWAMDMDGDPSSAVPTPVVDVGHASGDAPALSDRAGITRMGEGALSVMDLAGVAAVAEVGDDARERLVRAATVILCTADVVIPDFAFALVLEGEILARSEAGPVVARFGHGSVLRTRGTLDASIPAEFVASLDGTTLALWSEANLARALAGAPAVDKALRMQGDGLQAWAHVAGSSLGARLHEDVRLRLVSRLTARALLPGAELVRAGEPVPGLLLVGVGKITIDEPGAKVLGPGKFVFAEATLSAARASATARAGDDGAVVLSADRGTTQELCVTEPLLLELLATDF